MTRSTAALLSSLLIASFSTTAAPLGAPALNAGENIRQESGEVSVAGSPVTVIRYTWRDSASLPRSVSLVPGAIGDSPGYAVQMTFRSGGQDVILETEFGNGDGGFGYFVSHEVFRDFSEGGSGTLAPFHGFDDSPFGNSSNGGYTPLTGTAQSLGTQQAVHEFRLTYPHWGTVASVPDPSSTPVSTAPGTHQRFDLPVVIRWTFVAGQDFPLWSMEYDLSSATNHISVDVRAPYGVMNYRVNGALVSPAVTGLRWGDWYHFVADANPGDIAAAALVAGHLGWTWNLQNDGRRYNVLSSGSLEFGIVDTRLARGGTPSYADGYAPSRNASSASGSCTDAGVLQSLPCPYEWAYQSFQFDFGPPARPKLAWGTSPFLGSTLTAAYNGLENEPLDGTGRISYGVHIVMGDQTTGAPLTRARATSALEASPTLNVAVSPVGSGNVQYTILGNAGGPFTNAAMSLAPWSSVRLVATPAAGKSFAGWSGPCAGVAGTTCMIAMDQSRTVTANFSASGAGTLSVTPASIDFGAQSMGTSSGARVITVSNPGGTAVTLSGITASGAGFSQANDCGASLAPAASCTIQVTFAPAAAAGPVNSTANASGAITVSSNAAGSPQSVALAGVAEKSLVTHFYRTILHREPDGQGKTYWSDQAAHVAGLGADVNEAWYAMAITFFASAEYASFARDDAGFIGDVYLTFFDRAPDSSGGQYWSSQLQGGLPREVMLASFLFSPEFTGYTQGIFGNTAARAEVNVVMDFYRGLLARLPDDGGYAYWVQQFRNAQCSGNSANVSAQAESISSGFATSAEYANRARSNAQYVGDLYNAFLRRGGDLGGVQFWIGKLNDSSLSREQVRQQFRASSEFGARVNAIVNQGCI